MAYPMYRICYEATPTYGSMIDFRDLLCTELQTIPVPPEHTGLIVEVRTSGRFVGERSQLVLGLIRARKALTRNAPGQGEGCTGSVEEQGETFVELVDNTSQYAPAGQPLTAYSDLRLDIAVRAVAWTPMQGGSKPSFRSKMQRDPLRYRSSDHLGVRGAKKRRRLRREHYVESWGSAVSFTTLGERLPVKTTHAGEPLFPNMLVRLIVPPDYPLVIARSYLAQRLAANTAKQEPARQLCFEILYRP